MLRGKQVQTGLMSDVDSFMLLSEVVCTYDLLWCLIIVTYVLCIFASFFFYLISAVEYVLNGKAL